LYPSRDKFINGACMVAYVMVSDNVPPLSEDGPDKTCEECGEKFYSYDIPGREEYKCNDCKLDF